MCEGSSFWRWLAQVSVMGIRGAPRALVGTVKAVPGIVRAIKKPEITVAIRDPFNAFIIGLMALGASLMIPLITPDLTLTTRVGVALLSLPSFLLMMHAFYRARWTTAEEAEDQ